MDRRCLISCRILSTPIPTIMEIKDAIITLIQIAKIIPANREPINVICLDLEIIRYARLEFK